MVDHNLDHNQSEVELLRRKVLPTDIDAGARTTFSSFGPQPSHASHGSRPGPRRRRDRVQLDTEERQIAVGS